MPTPLKKLRWGLPIAATAVMLGLALVGRGWGGIAEAQTVATPTPVPSGPHYDVGTIVLCAVLPPAQAWVDVQWQDGLGAWHSVPSWPGLLLPMIAPDRPGAVCTLRWVVKSDFGKGPFRWVVYDQQGGASWGVSASFYFPVYAGQWVWSEIPGLTPASVPSGVTVVEPALGRPCGGVHVVHTGENLFRIAYTCGLTTAQLAARNHLWYPYIIYPGQVLYFP
jgi:hypothetical protein